MNSADLFGIGFGTGSAFFGFLWAKSNQIRNATLLDLARTGGLEKLADGRFYRIVHEGEWNRLNGRLRTVIAEVDTMWRREQETLKRLGCGFVAAETAHPSAEERRPGSPPELAAPYQNVGMNGDQVQDAHGYAVTVYGWGANGPPAAWRGAGRRGGLIDG